MSPKKRLNFFLEQALFNLKKQFEKSYTIHFYFIFYCLLKSWYKKNSNKTYFVFIHINENSIFF